jgi:hypothetical protein
MRKMNVIVLDIHGVNPLRSPHTYAARPSHPHDANPSP